MCRLCIVFVIVKDSPMNMISSRFRFVLVMFKCIREGCLEIIDPILIENSNDWEDMSLLLKLKLRMVVLRFIASMM